MSSENIYQVYQNNPITSNQSTDLIYIGSNASGGSGTDAAITYANFAAQFGGATPTEVQQSAFNVGTDTGVADAYIVDLSPAVTSLTNGLIVVFTPANANATQSPTLQINALSPVTIQLANSTAVSAGDIVNSNICVCVYNTANNVFELLNPIVSYANTSLIQANAYIAAFDSGTANSYIANTSPANPPSGGSFAILLNTLNNNTGASTLTVNGGSHSVLLPDGSPLSGNEILAGNTYLFLLSYPSFQWILLNSSISGGGGGISASQIQQQAFTYAVDSGTANSYIVTLSPAPSALTDGLYISFKATNANSGASVINVNGFGFTNIVTNSNSILIGGEILANSDYLLQYNSTFGAFVLINSSLGNGATPALSNTHIFVGNASNVATDVAMSGDATMANTGAITVTKTSGNAIASQVGIQKQTYTSVIGGGTANAITATLSPAVASYTIGLYVCVFPVHSNTGATTLNVNGVGAKPVVTPDGNALVGGEILDTTPASGMPYVFVYSTGNSGKFVLLNSSLNASSVNVQNQAFTYATDTGGTNTITIALTPAITAYSNGQMFLFEPNNANTGATTLNVNGLGAQGIVTNSNTALVGGEILLNHVYVVVYNSVIGKFVLLNSSLGGSSGNAPISSVISSGSAVNLPTATVTDVTSITLSVGRWLVNGNVSFTAAGGANYNYAKCWVSATSATLPDISLYAVIDANAVLGALIGMTTPSQIITVTSGTTTVFLSAETSFIGGTVTGCGGIYAIAV